MYDAFGELFLCKIQGLGQSPRRRGCGRNIVRPRGKAFPLYANRATIVFQIWMSG